MFLQPGFPEKSVKTIVTLSTPHMAPPATFDKGIEQIYSRINGFWRDTFSKPDRPSGLHDVLLISIAGGSADAQISSDYANVASIVPPSNGFAVLSTTVPSIFAPIDHLAVMWCDQLRQSIVSAIISSGAGTNATRTRSLPERLAVWKAHLLTGLHDHSHLSALPKYGEQQDFFRSDLQQVEGRKLSLPLLESGRAIHYSFNVNSEESPAVVTLLSNLSPSELILFQCKAGETIYVCTKLNEAVFRSIPLSTPHTSRYPVPPIVESSMLYAEQAIKKGFDTLVISLMPKSYSFLFVQQTGPISTVADVSLLRKERIEWLRCVSSDVTFRSGYTWLHFPDNSRKPLACSANTRCGFILTNVHHNNLRSAL